MSTVLGVWAIPAGVLSILLLIFLFALVMAYISDYNYESERQDDAIMMANVLKGFVCVWAWPIILPIAAAWLGRSILRDVRAA